MKLFASQQNILRNVPVETSQEIATFSFNVIKCKHTYTHGFPQNKGSRSTKLSVSIAFTSLLYC